MSLSKILIINCETRKKLKIGCVFFVGERNTKMFQCVKLKFICTFTWVGDAKDAEERRARATFLRWITLSRNERNLIATFTHNDNCCISLPAASINCKTFRKTRLCIPPRVAIIARDAGGRGVAFCFRGPSIRQRIITLYTPHLMPAFTRWTHTSVNAFHPECKVGRNSFYGIFRPFQFFFYMPDTGRSKYRLYLRR